MNVAIAAVRSASRQLFVSVDRMEIALVKRAVLDAECRGLRGAASAITRLGNGWLYAVLSAALLALRIEGSARFVFCSTVSILLAFVVYPPLKVLLARARPCEYDSTLSNGIGPLDRYSCPSGHAMTAAAYGVTMAHSWDAGLMAGIILAVTIGWSRVATGHHYVTDVLLGTAIGILIASRVATILY